VASAGNEAAVFFGGAKAGAPDGGNGALSTSGLDTAASELGIGNVAALFFCGARAGALGGGDGAAAVFDGVMTWSS
jgi:hypothetical protein